MLYVFLYLLIFNRPERKFSIMFTFSYCREFVKKCYGILNQEQNNLNFTRNDKSTSTVNCDAVKGHLSENYVKSTENEICNRAGLFTSNKWCVVLPHCLLCYSNFIRTCSDVIARKNEVHGFIRYKLKKMYLHIQKSRKQTTAFSDILSV